MTEIEFEKVEKLINNISQLRVERNRFEHYVEEAFSRTTIKDLFNDPDKDKEEILGFIRSKYSTNMEEFIDKLEHYELIIKP